MTRVVRRAPTGVYRRIREILESARTGVARTVNSAQVMANWLIGREIIEEEQKGVVRAGYGEVLLRGLAEQLQAEYGAGYSHGSLKLIRQFYLSYPELLSPARIGHTPCGLSRARPALLPSPAGQQELDL